MTANVQDLVSVVGIIGAIGAFWVRIEVKVAQIREWQAAHDRNDDARHGENQHRLASIEERLGELENHRP